MKKSQLLKLVREATKEVLNEQTSPVCYKNVVISTIGCPGSGTFGCGGNHVSSKAKFWVENKPGGFDPSDMNQEFHTDVANPSLPNFPLWLPHVGELCSYGPSYPCENNQGQLLTWAQVQSQLPWSKFSPTVVVHGCKDPAYCNYDPLVNCDDGSCTGIAGCMDPTACNHNPAAVCDDGSCQLPDGCTDSSACNFDPLATCDDGSCQQAPICNTDPCVGDVQWIDPAGNPCLCVTDPNATQGVFGCTDSSACNFDPLATCDDGSCQQAPICNTDICVGDTEIIDPTDPCSCIVDIVQVLGCMNNAACNFDSSANCDDNSCLTDYGCTDPTACNYDQNATCDDGSCQLPDGCTDPTACNYDQNATCDDGSCLTVYGCTDSAAYNYDPLADCDDGSCIDQSWDCDPNTFSCNDPGTGNGQYTTLIDCQNNCTPPPFTPGCPPNHPFHSWPSLEMTGPAIVNGSPSMNLQGVADKNLYCEYCSGYGNYGTSYTGNWSSSHPPSPGDFNYNNYSTIPGAEDTTIISVPAGIVAATLQFGIEQGVINSNPPYTVIPPNQWVQGTPSYTGGAASLDWMNVDWTGCGCCPEFGGPSIPIPQLSLMMSGPEPIEDKDKICCDWCATVDPNKPSLPPRGCEDWNCNDCPEIPKTPTIPQTPVVSESYKKRLQKLANISKK